MPEPRTSLALKQSSNTLTLKFRDIQDAGAVYIFTMEAVK